jgi:hypothetical protein
MRHAVGASETHNKENNQETKAVDPHALGDFIQEALTGKAPTPRERTSVAPPHVSANQEQSPTSPPHPHLDPASRTEHHHEGIGPAGGTGETAAATSKKDEFPATTQGLLLQQKPTESTQASGGGSTRGQVEGTASLSPEAAAAAAAVATVAALTAEMRSIAEALGQHGDAWADKATRLAGQVCVCSLFLWTPS